MAGLESSPAGCCLSSEHGPRAKRLVSARGLRRVLGDRVGLAGRDNCRAGRLALLAAGAVLPEPLDACRADTSVLCPARYSAGRPCCGPQPATRPVRRGERPCERGVPRLPGPGGPRMLFALSECISRRVAPSSTTAMGVSGTFGWAVPSSRSAGMPSMPGGACVRQTHSARGGRLHTPGPVDRGPGSSPRVR